MDKEKIISCLVSLGFSKLESEIYIVLLDGAKSGYNIAKKINISRPSVYNALEHMYDKGIVLQLHDGSSEYIAQHPSVIFKRLREEYTENTHIAEKELSEYANDRFEERLATLKGFKTIIARAEEMIINSKHDVFINTGIGIAPLKNAINAAAENSTCVTVFSFYELDAEDINCNIFSHGREQVDNCSRLMLSCDGREILVANKSSENGEWIASVTNNPLMVDIITEHIHNDIYLLRLRDRFGTEIYDKLRIGSRFESLDRLKK